MEFLRPSRRRTLLSETVYISLNVGVALLIFAMVYLVGSPLAAFGVVVLSKWRVFAVRPQYWYAHVIANSIDVIVGLSFVVFLTAAAGELVVQAVFTALYIAWLLILKPQSKRFYVVIQAAFGMLLGVAALAQLSYDWYASVFVIGMWVVGFSAARHTLLAYQEPHTRILSVLWGLVVAELGWISYHWTIAYALPFTDGVQIAQIALIATLLGFLAERSYASYHTHKEVRLSDITLPLLLSLSLIALLVTLFGATQSI